ALTPPRREAFRNCSGLQLVHKRSAQNRGQTRDRHTGGREERGSRGTTGGSSASSSKPSGRRYKLLNDVLS
ncbi:hypothetical protein MUK42_07503, partial [Musa troglodytarum]